MQDIVYVGFITLLLGVHTIQQCDQGWSYYAASNRCFRLQNSQLAWYSADDDCQNYGARLASIPNAFAQNFIQRDENKDKACIDIHTGTSNWHTNDCQQQECFICEKNADEPSNRASDCKQLMSQGQTASGVYTIYVNGAPKTVYCDMQTDGGGWTVIQQRVNGAVSFWDQTWQAYKNGFGVAGAATEFWAGNDLIHQLTTQTSGNILRVDLWGDRNPNSTNPNIYLTSNYNFSLNDESTEYTPNIWSTFPGVGNASTGWYDITYINGTKFSTIDHINDPMQTCVTDYHLGGWWLHYCTTSSLNGQYIPPISYGNGYGMFWVVNGYEIINPTKSKMMIRSI